MNGCRECGQNFTTVKAFDEHRTGFHAFTYSEGIKMEPQRDDGRRCMTFSEMTEFGWSQDNHGQWRYPRDWESQQWRWELDPNEVEFSA